MSDGAGSEATISHRGPGRQGPAERPSAPTAGQRRGAAGLCPHEAGRSVTRPSSPQTKSGVTPFPRAVTVLGRLGRSPPAGPSALAALGCARPTGEEKVLVPLPGTACPSTSHPAAITAGLPSGAAWGCPARSGLFPEMEPSPSDTSPAE